MNNFKFFTKEAHLLQVIAQLHPRGQWFLFASCSKWSRVYVWIEKPRTILVLEIEAAASILDPGKT